MNSDIARVSRAQCGHEEGHVHRGHEAGRIQHGHDVSAQHAIEPL